MNIAMSHDGKSRGASREDKLIALYAMASENAFGWAKLRREGEARPESLSKGEAPATKQAAAAWLDSYISGLPNGNFVTDAQRPGRATHLIGLAFADMTRTAEEWEAWGYRLSAAHDMLVALRDGQRRRSIL